jgi:phosphoribosylformylglycinamidine (FGAM) synthase PurS component
MQKSTIQFLLINCFLAIVLVSCGSVTKNYTPKKLDKTSYVVPYFSDSKTDYVYKTNISVYGNELSGIFIAKKINDTTHRIVFTTEFGNKLMDFEISETDFKVNSIVSELDRKILINTLKEDFRLLLKKEYLIQEQFENESADIYKSADGKRDNYIFISKKDQKLEKIVHSSKTKEKITLYFNSENNIFAEKIQIIHQNIKLKIELNYFKSE